MGGGLNNNTSLQNSMNGSIMGIYDTSKPPNPGISALKFGSRNLNNNLCNSKASAAKSTSVPPPAPLPDNAAVNNSFGILNAAIGGGGLSRASGMNLGRHQI